MGTNQSRDSLNCGTDQGSACNQCEVELDHIQTWRYLTWVALSLTLLVSFIYKGTAAAAPFIDSGGGGRLALRTRHRRTTAVASAAEVADARTCVRRFVLFSRSLRWEQRTND